MKEKIESIWTKLSPMFVFGWKNWLIKNLILIGVIAAIFILWLFPISLITAPLYGFINDSKINIITVKPGTGITTVTAMKNAVDKLEDELLINQVGTNFWIDNRINEQIGYLSTLRVGFYGLENYLGRNRGTGGANKYLSKARANINSDETLPIFTSFNTRLKETSKNMNSYLLDLEKEMPKKINERTAVFIVNSDNLGKYIDVLKQNLQTSLADKRSGLFKDDDKFYNIRGNLKGIRDLLKAAEVDFKDKLKHKSAYESSYVPLLELIDKAIEINPWFITNLLGHVDTIERDASIISQKMSELIGKLNQG